jgi:hypothetical protein
MREYFRMMSRKIGVEMMSKFASGTPKTPKKIVLQSKFQQFKLKMIFSCDKTSKTSQKTPTKTSHLFVSKRMFAITRSDD